MELAYVDGHLRDDEGVRTRVGGDDEDGEDSRVEDGRHLVAHLHDLRGDRVSGSGAVD